VYLIRSLVKIESKFYDGTTPPECSEDRTVSVPSNGTLTGPNTIATVLLAETLLAFLPSMSIYNVTYWSSTKLFHCSLVQCKETDQSAQFPDARGDSVLVVDRPRIQRFFIPLESFPTPRRGRKIELITFLNSIQTINRGEIAAKASTAYPQSILWKFGANSAKPLLTETFSKAGKFWFCHAWFYDNAEYAEKLLNPDVLPTSMGMQTPLLFAFNLVLRSQLVVGFAQELQEQCFSLPTLTTHAGRQQMTGIEVVILSKHRMATLIANERGKRCLQENKCKQVYTIACSLSSQSRLLKYYNKRCNTSYTTNCQHNYANSMNAHF